MNTDFIDNSAGVNTSDVEVNLKILLNPLVLAGKLRLQERDQVLTRMTGDVAALSTAGVATLTSSKIGGLNTADVAALSTGQVAVLSTSAASVLSTAQIEAANPSFSL